MITENVARQRNASVIIPQVLPHAKTTLCPGPLRQRRPENFGSAPKDFQVTGTQSSRTGSELLQKTSARRSFSSQNDWLAPPSVLDPL